MPPATPCSSRASTPLPARGDTPRSTPCRPASSSKTPKASGSSSTSKAADKPHKWPCPHCQTVFEAETRRKLIELRAHHMTRRHRDIPWEKRGKLYTPSEIVEVSMNLPVSQRDWECPRCDASLPKLRCKTKLYSVRRRYKTKHKGRDTSGTAVAKALRDKARKNCNKESLAASRLKNADEARSSTYWQTMKEGRGSSTPLFVSSLSKAHGPLAWETPNRRPGKPRPTPNASASNSLTPRPASPALSASKSAATATRTIFGTRSARVPKPESLPSTETCGRTCNPHQPTLRSSFKRGASHTSRPTTCLSSEEDTQRHLSSRNSSSSSSTTKAQLGTPAPKRRTNHQATLHSTQPVAP